ncbi:hypothetical protein U9M48_000968 [Paspalum notatum var. saurae]|uniref:AAA+ ATPase domain-containing protein n=1 Tax=Paspalum notatum var. saurae TaxID=547442 RepID=A0AAQ3SCN5_PASNO
MADYLKTAGWLVLVSWWLTPIISLLVNKLFAYLFSNVSRKFSSLETITVPYLKQTLISVLEQRMQRVVEDKGSRDDLKTLAKLEEDIKSAFYEAQDIMDTVEYHRTEEEALGHTSSWVQCRLLAARASIACCFWRSCFCFLENENILVCAAAHTRFLKSWFCLGRWINVTRAALLQCVLRLYQLGRFIIQGLVCKMHSAIHTALAMLRQCAQCLCQQHLLPVSVETTISESRGSMVGPGTLSATPPIALEATVGAAEELDGANPPLKRPAEKVVEDKEKVKGEIEEEDEDDDIDEEEDEEKKDEEKGAPWRCIRQCFQSILILFANAIVVVRFVRDWPYEVFSIKSNQRGEIAEYSFFPPFGTNSLSKRIEHIENIVDGLKKSNLLNQQSSCSEILVQDNNKESSSSSEFSIKDTKKETSTREEQIDNLHRKIERKVFGRDKELKRICGMFRKRPDRHHSKPYSVLGVHGIAGSGKSTLAYYICDHEKKAEDKYFDLIMFSHMSVTFRVDKIFCDMLREITKGQQCSSKDIETLRDKLTRKLKEKRFLLVLDDVWFCDKNQKEQDILLDALRAGKSGSRILVTAQTKDAATALGAEEQMLIPDLEDEEYLSLFMHHALQGTVDHDGKFERIGRSIAKKLLRSPIPAVSVGRRLQAEKCISFWETTANLDVLNETMGALWWSFQQLGVDTRRCFQYCSTFPKGYKLDRFELVHCWIAQGFVNTTSNATEELEDVGQRYLEELVKFSFLQVTIFGTDRFTIHDLLHKLVEMVAGSEAFRLDDLNGLPVKDIPPGVRHLFIETKNVAQVEQIAQKNLDLGNLHTLIIKEPFALMQIKNRRHDLEKFIECLFIRLRKLRVLIIELDTNPKELSFPASIVQLKHLRYFSFNCVFTHEGLILPSTFSKLYQMQTILFGSDLNCLTMSYPVGMDNLIRLRHIRDWQGFPNIGRIKSLQTMHFFLVKKEQGCLLKQLKHLNKLRGHLKIDGLENVGSKEEAFEADLASKKRVTYLELAFGWHRTKDADMEAEVLEGLCPPTHLHELTIKGYNGSRYPSWMLSGQQHPDAPKQLRKLVLRYCNCPLASFPEDSEIFMNLRELEIKFCEWDSLSENMECLMSLQSLDISGYGCNKMVLLPTLPRSLHKISICKWDLVLENMEHLVSLESLDIYCCDKMELLPTLPQSLMKIRISCCDVLSRTCQEEGHENWQKIQHVPCKEIDI